MAIQDIGIEIDSVQKQIKNCMDSKEKERLKHLLHYLQFKFKNGITESIAINTANQNR